MSDLTDEEGDLLKIVNIVGSGDLDREIDLHSVCEDIDIEDAEVHEEMNGLLIRFAEIDGLIVLYRSGKYIIRGSNEFSTFHRINDQFIESMSDLGIISKAKIPTPSVKNIVFLGDIKSPVNLDNLVLKLGLEATEFEPEQFPGLIYRPPDSNCVLLIFSTGKVVITGVTDEEIASEAYKRLVENI